METNVGGTRRLHRGALRAREFVVERERGVGRKELMSAARECAEGLQLRASVRLVLAELAACYGEQQLDKGLIVWPSNDHLSRRTGLVERTIRKCVSELVALSVVLPMDSANRKRFAIRAENGDVLDAFGFDLAPLFARRQEWTAMLMRQRLEREARSRLFDEITMSRKAAEEALAAAASVGVDVSSLGEAMAALARRTPRRGQSGSLDAVIRDWAAVRKSAEDAFFVASDNSKESGRTGKSFRHIETNKEPSTEGCTKVFRSDETAKPADTLKPSLIVEACPALKDYDEPLTTTDEIARLGRYLRPSIGAHLDAWTEAERSVGPNVAAALVLYVLQLVADDQTTSHARIRNPGGLYRDLVRRASAGTFDLGEELRRMRRKRMQ